MPEEKKKKVEQKCCSAVNMNIIPSTLPCCCMNAMINDARQTSSGEIEPSLIGLFWPITLMHLILYYIYQYCSLQSSNHHQELPLARKGKMES